MANPWVRTFTPLNTYYVGPTATGTGSGLNLSNLKSFAAAKAAANPGDLMLMVSGDYTNANTAASPSNTIKFTRAGTATNPIVWKAYEDYSSGTAANVFLHGNLQLFNYNVAWGWHITNPDNLTQASPDPDGGLAIGPNDGGTANGAAGINCTVHEVMGRNGISDFNRGTDMLMYGCATYLSRHCWYGQNDFNTRGWKYVVNNYFGAGNVLYPGGESSGARILQFYGTVPTTGLHFMWNHCKSDPDNSAFGTQLIFGGTDKILTDFIKVDTNFGYKIQWQCGYDSPAMWEFLNNYSGRCLITGHRWWGTNDVKFGAPTYPRHPNRILSNISVGKFPPGTSNPRHINIQTARFDGSGATGNGVALADCGLRSTDDVNNNQYFGSGASDFAAKCSSTPAGGTVTSIASWRTVTASAGKQFDTNSTYTSTMPTNTVIKAQDNEYDHRRLMFSVYNWGLASSPTVDLNAFVPIGSQFWVYPVEDQFNPPIVSGAYTGPFSLPMSSAEHGVFILRMKEDPALEEICVNWLPELERIYAKLMLVGRVTSKVRESRTELGKLIENIKAYPSVKAYLQEHGG